MLFRSEAYLNASESAAKLYESGRTEMQTIALNHYNTLRKYRIASKRFVNYETNNAQELVEEIRTERRRELCFENHRWFDLRRYGMPKIIHTWYTSEGELEEYILEENDPGYTLLIPATAFEYNNLLVQNPKRN